MLTDHAVIKLQTWPCSSFIVKTLFSSSTCIHAWSLYSFKQYCHTFNLWVHCQANMYMHTYMCIAFTYYIALIACQVTFTCTASYWDSWSPSRLSPDSPFIVLPPEFRLSNLLLIIVWRKASRMWAYTVISIQGSKGMKMKMEWEEKTMYVMPNMQFCCHLVDVVLLRLPPLCHISLLWRLLSPMLDYPLFGQCPRSVVSSMSPLSETVVFMNSSTCIERENLYTGCILTT